ncbi:hypothetical protein WN51_09341 [Melipona quadrifasciata]|uniref:Uncharacterized protein n=1 Tax=Melipona quadrifasciata TaxID=166423 RepID=A0A0M9A6W4_9HYME|nr:hypothetical protein WN51_09341 [Melipona quadrifasciata]
MSEYVTKNSIHLFLRQTIKNKVLLLSGIVQLSPIYVSSCSIMRPYEYTFDSNLLQMNTIECKVLFQRSQRVKIQESDEVRIDSSHAISRYYFPTFGKKYASGGTMFRDATPITPPTFAIVRGKEINEGINDSDNCCKKFLVTSFGFSKNEKTRLICCWTRKRESKSASSAIVQTYRAIERSANECPRPANANMAEPEGHYEAYFRRTSGRYLLRLLRIKLGSTSREMSRQRRVTASSLFMIRTNETSDRNEASRKISRRKRLALIRPRYATENTNAPPVALPLRLTNCVRTLTLVEMLPGNTKRILFQNGVTNSLAWVMLRRSEKLKFYFHPRNKIPIKSTCRCLKNLSTMLLQNQRHPCSRLIVAVLLVRSIGILWYLAAHEPILLELANHVQTKGLINNQNKALK